MAKQLKRTHCLSLCLGVGLALFLFLMGPLHLATSVQAQTGATFTPTYKLPILIPPRFTLVAPPLDITAVKPTTVVTNVLLFNLDSVLLADSIKTTADLNYTDQFKAKIEIQSPASMLMGDTRVVTLEIVPELLAQASMVRARLIIVNFDSRDDGQEDKTVLENIPVSWSWIITPQATGSHEFFMAVSYQNQQGSWVHWQNIPLGVNVLLPPSETPSPTLDAADTLPPTFTPEPEETPTATITLTSVPTQTNSAKFITRFLDDPVAVLGLCVTLVLGLLTIYFQFIRKGGKSSDGK